MYQYLLLFEGEGAADRVDRSYYTSCDCAVTLAEVVGLDEIDVFVMLIAATRSFYFMCSDVANA